MNRKLLTGGLIALIAAFLVAYFASPVLAVRGLTEAARSGDEAALRERVDFPRRTRTRCASPGPIVT